ncbi:MAG TPA: hypothetical protein VNA21_15285 [Steroidobacteraceae bacterium]|nr:hypothetical protein [Steroidobacteraceae bacterium]
MEALKDWIHRNRWLAGLIERAKNQRRDETFAKHLDASIGEAVRWQTPDEALQCARRQLKALTSLEDQPPRKGSPSKVRIRSKDLQLLLDTLSTGDRVDAHTFRAAERVASIDPADLSAFKLYLSVVWLANAELIRALRATSRDRVVLHMSCVPRLNRANKSIESFGNSVSSLQHLKLVGTGQDYTFDTATQLLGVPAGDSYECLPQKVFQALALLTLAHNPSTLVKLDDDHRLANASELEKLLSFAAASSEAMQLGEVNLTPSPSAHHRGWHFGKCARSELNDQIVEMPAPAKWAAGSAGYIVNRGALWRILWASLYYRQWLEAILYEDIALAEVATKTGIRIVQVRMNRAIGAVTEY